MPLRNVALALIALVAGGGCMSAPARDPAVTQDVLEYVERIQVVDGMKRLATRSAWWQESPLLRRP